jgi:hypothetical protein
VGSRKGNDNGQPCNLQFSASSHPATTMEHGGPVPSVSSETDGIATSSERGEHFKFTHPAGLTIARHLTKSVIEALNVRMWQNGTTQSSPEGNLESSVLANPVDLLEPDVTEDLRTILAFEDMSDLTPQRNEGVSSTATSTPAVSDQQTHNTSNSHPDPLMNSWTAESDFEADSAIPNNTSTSSYTARMSPQPQATNRLNLNRHGGHDSYEGAHFSVVSRPTSTELNRSAFNLPPPSTLYPENLHTSKSQSGSYHRQPESGPRQESTIYQQKSPHLPSSLTSPAQAQLPGPGQLANPIQLPKIDLPRLGSGSIGQSGFSAVRHPLPSITTSDNSNRILLSQLQGIKSFLPVNKSINGNNVSGKSTSSSQTLSSSSSFRPDDSSRSNNIHLPQGLAGKQAAPPSAKQTTADKYSLPVTSTSSTHSTPTAQFYSNTLYDFSSGALQTTTMGKRSIDKTTSKKRKAKDGAEIAAKKQKVDKKAKPFKREPGGESVSSLLPYDCMSTTDTKQAKVRLGDDIWMRIFEFSPPSFLKKARLVCKPWKDMVDKFDSLFVNCRKENYGMDMPPPPPGMTERQYSDLLGGKGCQEPGCDNKKATRTYWSWSRRWCSDCWGKIIEREDRIIKNRQNQFPRATVVKMLESIPVAIYDSFLKPHDYTENVVPTVRGPPRLYKCYLIADVDRIVEEYKALEPPPYVANPDHTPAEASAAQAAHKVLTDALPEKRDEFFAAKKAINDKHMANVTAIEKAIRQKRQEERQPKDKARKGRIELFTRRAKEEMPHIATEFVQATKAFKAACRIYRDGGTERGWRSLKPKIEKEWEDRDLNPPKPQSENQSDLRGVSMDTDSMLGDMDDFPSMRSTPTVDIGRAVQQHQHQHQHQHQQHAQLGQQSMYNNMQQACPRPNHPLRQSSGPIGGPLGFNNYGNSNGYNYNSVNAGPLMSQPSLSSSAFPGNFMMGGGLQRALPQPTNFRPPQYRQPSSYSMNGAYHHNQPPHLGSQSTHIPINSLLTPPNPPIHQRHNQHNHF